jgi:PAS domain S-box-containing protein
MNPNSKAKVLYVDDESINLRLFKISFRANYDIHTALSAEEGLLLIRDLPYFDIIVSDQRMPGISGTEFMIQAKKTLPYAKYILLTGYTDIEALENAINKVGLWQYIKKPWETSNLKFVLDNAFSSLKTEKENIRISSALKQSEERLNLALYGTNAGVWDWNLITNEIYLSSTWKQMLGYSEHELDNNLKTLEELLHPDDLQKSFTHLDEYIQGKISEYELEYRLKHKNGTYVHILSRGKGKKNEKDEFDRLTGTNIDLTEKYKAQQEIKDLNEKLEERVERRTHALKLLNIELIKRNKFEHLISKISSELIGIQMNELEGQISIALSDIIQFNKSENAFVLKFENEEITVEHQNHNSSNFSDITKLFHKKKSNSFPFIFEKLKKKEPFLIKDLNSLSDQQQILKDKLIDAQINSVLIIPLSYNKQLKGALGVSCKELVRNWNHEDVNLLKFIGEIFMNSFERNENEKQLINRDKEISEANEKISENEKKTKLLQSIASVANSPLKVDEALALSQEIIIAQGKGISGLLIKIDKNNSNAHFTLENIIAKNEQEKNNLRSILLTSENILKDIINKTIESFEPILRKGIKLNNNSDTVISSSFDISSIPVIVNNEMQYIYLTLLSTNNTLFSEPEILKNISREISFLSERDKTKKELKKALEREKELGELKSQFVSMASHQFRTPLTVIQSNIELFQMLAINIDHELKDKFDKISIRIQNEVSRLVELMNDVLLLGKLNAEVLTPKSKSSDIVFEIRGAVNKLNSIQKDGRKAEVRTNGIIKNIPLDKKLFAHAFTNLIDNAFKYSRGKSAPIIEISFEKSLVNIKVIDFGKGIPEDDIPNLFQPFYRSKNAQDVEGTGLGLVICKKYIELQNGVIKVHSILNKRTTFIISLPY